MRNACIKLPKQSIFYPNLSLVISNGSFGEFSSSQLVSLLTLGLSNPLFFREWTVKMFSRLSLNNVLPRWRWLSFDVWALFDNYYSSFVSIYLSLGKSGNSINLLPVTLLYSNLWPTDLFALLDTTIFLTLLSVVKVGESLWFLDVRLAVALGIISVMRSKFSCWSLINSVTF